MHRFFPKHLLHSDIYWLRKSHIAQKVLDIFRQTEDFYHLVC